MGSNRSFGYFFAALFTGVGAYLAWKGSGTWAAGSLVLAIVLAALAALAPSSLAPANRAWHALGILLARIVNPVVVGLMFFIVITPIGLLMRAFGKRPLSLRFEAARASYWIERTPHGPAPQSMSDQF